MRMTIMIQNRKCGVDSQPFIRSSGLCRESIQSVIMTGFKLWTKSYPQVQMVMNMFIHSPAEVTDVLQAKKERVNHHWANRIWQRVYSSRFLRFYGIWYDESGLSLERKRRETRSFKTYHRAIPLGRRVYSCPNLLPTLKMKSNVCKL